MKTMNKKEKIALGTAQFGLPYGVANHAGQVPPYEIRKILKSARQAGVATLDTAIAYGESEQALGQQNLQEFTVVTKLPEVPADCTSVTEWVNQQLQASLERLGISSLDGLLLHRPSQLLQPFGSELYQAMLGLRQQGLVRRIGISVYDPTELQALCDVYQFNLVQAPFNILDQRLVQSGWIEKLSRMGTALHVRSVFMQGLLLMEKSNRPNKFARWNSVWEEWEQWLNITGQTPVEACLRHALSIPQIERVIVGVDSVVQWQDILKAADGPSPAPPEGLGCTDVELLNPSNWNSL